MHGDLVKQWRRPELQCEHLHSTPAGNLRQCEEPARWRISSAIKVVIGNYCDRHLPVRMWPGWRKDKA